MNARITSIENLIATDPSGRNVFALALPDQLRMAAQSLRLARRVGLVSGFYVPEAGAGETDGPPGAKVLGDALTRLGVEVDYLTDQFNAPIFRALGIDPIIETDDYLLNCRPTHLVAIERVGRCRDGTYRNIRGNDISPTTAPLDQLFIEAGQLGLTTIGIGDGGNEIGMGKIFAQAEAEHFGLSSSGRQMDLASHCVISTDFCIVAGVSNWGAFGLAGALSVLAGQDLLPSADQLIAMIHKMVSEGGAVDGMTMRAESTCDGQDVNAMVRMLERIRRQIAPSPLAQSDLLVGVIGYGEAGRAAARLVTSKGHRLRISDQNEIQPEENLVVDAVESGCHTEAFLRDCDVIVVSPGVHPELPILDRLRCRGIYMISELELAFQLSQVSGEESASDLIAVTGTIGKQATVERLSRVFAFANQPIQVGGNRSDPFSKLLVDHEKHDAIALAVSSFQLETVVHFRTHIAIVLNIDAAHLDRHRTLAEYVRIKSRIFMNQRPDDILILPYDNPSLRMLARKHQGRTVWCSMEQVVDRGAWISNGRVMLNIEGNVEELGPVGASQPEPLLAAVLAARLFGIDQATIARFLETQNDEDGQKRWTDTRRS